MTAPVVIDVDPEDRETWLETRRQGIGSSDAAALFGLDRFSSAWSVYVDKVEAVMEDEQSEALEWGHRLEPLIADKFGDEHPEFHVVKPKVMYRHAEHPFAMASPDRLLFEKGADYASTWGEGYTGLLECKSSNLDEDWSDDAPPDRVVIQCQHQNLVMGTELTICGALLHGRYYREYEVHRDESVIDLLVNVEGEFWQRVVDRRPPAADGHAATSDAIKRAYASVDPGSVVELGDTGAALLRRRSELKSAVKDVSADLAKVENELKAASKGAAVWLVRGEIASTWNTVNAQRVDTKALEADHPELVAQYRKPAPHRRLDVKKGWK